MPSLVTLQPVAIDLFLGSNLTGTVADIDEGVDIPDGDQLTCIDQSLSTGVNIYFSPPLLTPGADLQTFRAWVKKTSPGGTDPGMALVLAELDSGSGTQLAIRVVAQTTISSTTGQLVEGTFNISEVSDPSAMSLRIDGGTTPGDDRNIHIDAVEWLATVENLGEAVGDSSSDGVGASEHRAAAASSGLSIVGAFSAGSFTATGTAVGAATVAAVGQSQARGEAMAFGASTVEATSSQWLASSLGTSTATAVGRSEARAVATAAGTASVGAVGRWERIVTLAEFQTTVERSSARIGFVEREKLLNAALARDIAMVTFANLNAPLETELCRRVAFVAEREEQP